MLSLLVFYIDLDSNRVPFIAQGTEALVYLKEMNPKIDTIFSLPN